MLLRPAPDSFMARIADDLEARALTVISEDETLGATFWWHALAALDTDLSWQVHAWQVMRHELVLPHLEPGTVFVTKTSWHRTFWTGCLDDQYGARRFGRRAVASRSQPQPRHHVAGVRAPQVEREVLQLPPHPVVTGAPSQAPPSDEQSGSELTDMDADEDQGSSDAGADAGHWYGWHDDDDDQDEVHGAGATTLPNSETHIAVGAGGSQQISQFASAHMASHITGHLPSSNILSSRA